MGPITHGAYPLDAHLISSKWWWHGAVTHAVRVWRGWRPGCCMQAHHVSGWVVARQLELLLAAAGDFDLCRVRVAVAADVRVSGCVRRWTGRL